MEAGQPIPSSFRLGTLRTRSGNFLTYFLRPLREWRAHTSFVWSLKRGGTALLPCVSPFTNSTIFAASSRARHASNAAIDANTSVYPSSASPEPYGPFFARLGGAEAGDGAPGSTGGGGGACSASAREDGPAAGEEGRGCVCSLKL